MTHFLRVLKARRLKNKFIHFAKEKQIGLSIDEDESDLETPKEGFSGKLKKKFQNGALGRFIAQIKTPNTIQNVVWKSFLGFLGGVALTYIFFFFFYVGVNFSLKTTTYICGLAGIILSLGLAYSSKIRCYVFLLLPVFFSKQGRQALLAYALFLAFTGPAKTTMHNMGILSDSMACGQEMVRRTLRQIIDMVKAPFRSIKDTIQKIAKAVKEVVETVKTFIMKIKRIIVSVLKVIKKATTWLGSIINFCNKKVGTPFQRCMKTFDDAIADCKSLMILEVVMARETCKKNLFFLRGSLQCQEESITEVVDHETYAIREALHFFSCICKTLLFHSKAKLGIMDFLCHVVHVVKALCYTVKWLDFICMFTEFVSEKIIGVVKKKLRQFSLHMKNLFYVSIEFSHSYEFETTASNSTKQVAKTILQKISAKVEKLQNIFSFFGFIFSLFFVLVFFKVYYYKYKYLTSDRFDNMFISKYIVELDLKRAELDRETVLPLEPKEKKIYGKPTSLRLLREEKARMAKSMFLLSLTSFKIISFIVCDYSLYWVLFTIYEAGHDTLEEVEKSKMGIHVEGKGVLANFYRKLGKTFQVPENPNMHLNPLHCLPDPVTPDTGRYIQIGFLVALCWLLTVTEAYGLRLRNVVMSHYYPDRARERAVWLYNHILRSRGSFIRYARRQLRRKFQFGGGPAIEKVTLTQRLFSSFPLLGAIFGRKKENTCLLCGALETKTEPLKRCRTPDCPGRYCLKCFASLENVCTICQHPIEYGDISDISEEIDSSEEELYRRSAYDSSRSTYDSDSSRNDEKFMTFKDLEHRDRFKDIEANKMIDYAKLGDLYSDKTALKKRLKEVLLKRLQNLEIEKKRSQILKKNEYKKLKLKLQDVITALKNSKSENAEGKKPMGQKLGKKMKALKQRFKKNEIEYENLSDNETKPTKSRVSFDLRNEKKISLPKSKDDYEKLKNEVKEKIKSLKENKNQNQWESDKSLKNEESSSESSGKTFKDETLTYYFVPIQNTDFYVPEPLDFEGMLPMNSSLMIPLEENPLDPRL